MEHARVPCPSLSPEIFPSSYPCDKWFFTTISSSAALFSFCLQSFPASGSFPTSLVSVSSSQSIGASALVLPMSIQETFRKKTTTKNIILPCTWAKSCQLCPTLYNSVDCSLPGSSVHGIFQARILEWVALLSFRGSSWPRDDTFTSYVFCIGRQVLYH